MHPTQLAARQATRLADSLRRQQEAVRTDIREFEQRREREFKELLKAEVEATWPKAQRDELHAKVCAADAEAVAARIAWQHQRDQEGHPLPVGAIVNRTVRKYPPFHLAATAVVQRGIVEIFTSESAYPENRDAYGQPLCGERVVRLITKKNEPLKTVKRLGPFYGTATEEGLRPESDNLEGWKVEGTVAKK